MDKIKKIKCFLLKNLNNGKNLKNKFDKIELISYILFFISITLNSILLLLFIMNPELFKTALIINSILTVFLISNLFLINFLDDKIKNIDSFSIEEVIKYFKNNTELCFKYLVNKNLNYLISNKNLINDLSDNKKNLFEIFDLILIKEKSYKILENKESLEFIYKNKEWILTYFKNTSEDNQLDLLLNEEFIIYIRDIEEATLFKYMNKLIKNIERELIKDPEKYYSVILNLFTTLNNKELNSLRYLNSKLKEENLIEEKIKIINI